MKYGRLLIAFIALNMNTLTNAVAGNLNPDSIINTFRGHQTNRIDNAHCLDGFFEKLNNYSLAKENKEECGHRPKVLMIGDSHVAGKVLPTQLNDTLSRAWDFCFESYSKIGVQLNYFLKDELMNKILAYKPDLLIVALGTNEANDENFSTERYTRLLQTFYDRVMRGSDSTTTLLFTTAPGAYKKLFRTDKKTFTRVNNPRNKVVADCQIDFCNTHNIAIWDLLDMAGGAIAAENWKRARLMTPDSIHYTAEGYTIHAQLLATALINAKRQYDEKTKDNENDEDNTISTEP